MPRSWIPPVFSLVVLVAIVAGAGVFMGSSGFTHGQRALSLVVLALMLAVIGAVSAKCLAHQDGVWDWWNGGVAYLLRDDGMRLGWSDWAILVSRHGRIHKPSRRLRIETRWLCGLLPGSVTECVLSPGSRVQVDHLEVMTYQRSALGNEHPYGWSGGSYVRRRQRYDHLVTLHQDGAEPIYLLDLSSRNETDESSGFADKLGRVVGQAIGGVDRR
jgi:hypothetical protein